MRFRHLLHRLVHYLSWYLIAFFICLTLLPIAELVFHLPTYSQSIAVSLMCCVMLALILGNLQVHKALCEHCIASMPLDGPGRAERRNRHMAVVHFVSDNEIRYLVIVFAWLIAEIGLPMVVGRVAAGLLVFPPIVYFVWSNEQHKQLRPWCTRCGWGRGGGGGDRSTAPTPDPAVSR